MLDTLLFVSSVIISAALLFCMVFFVKTAYVIMFSDLECDFVNPIDLCAKLNPFVLPEYGLHWILTGLMLLNFQWIGFLLNLPLALYHLHRIKESRHWFDPTEIFRKLPEHKRESFIKLTFYLICFFYFLYRMILALID